MGVLGLEEYQLVQNELPEFCFGDVIWVEG